MKCEKCGHEWIQRVENPLKCPKCGHIRGSRVYKKRGQKEAEGS
jgi:rubrerythrin